MATLIPPLAGPDGPLEVHANLWQSVLQGLLQRAEGSGCGPAQFHTTLVGASQQLYKDTKVHAAAMPRVMPATVRTLLKGKESLRKLIWRVASGRTAEWGKRPRGHAVIEALCSKAAKGHALRSSLCSTSFITEGELERAFAKLTQRLSAADPNDAVSEDAAFQEWKQRVAETLCRDIRNVANVTTRGSPLRRLEAADGASSVARNLIRRMSIQRGDQP